MDEFRDGMDKLAAMYVNDFINKPDETLQMFCNTTVPLEVMNNVYGYMVNEKSIEAIEDLPETTKLKLWNQVKETCPGASKIKSIKLCRTTMLINYVLEK